MKKLIIQTQGVKALIVDDNEVNLMIAKTILEKYGIEVDPVQSGKEAIEKAKSTDYDLIVMDCLMPEMDGLETTRNIRALPGKIANIPVVAYTSSREDEVLETYGCVGVENVLVKPMESIEVTKVLLKYISPSKLVGAEKVREQLMQWQSDPEPKEAAKKSELQKALETVEDLDYNTGIHYAVDSDENYLRVLKAACESITEAITHFRYYQKRQAEPHSLLAVKKKPVGEYDLSTVHIDAHSMKGIFACIGMDALSHASAEIERMSLPDARLPQLLEHLHDYTEWLEAVRDSLRSALEQYQSNQGEKEQAKVVIVPIPAGEYRALLEDTKLHVARFEIDAITEGLQRLVHATTAEATRKKLQDAINASEIFDYTTVGKILADITPEG